MTKKETAALLGMFALYWPNFSIMPKGADTPGTIDAWSAFLEPYTQDECANALKNFRVERSRSFAPTASEFEGELIREKNERSVRAALDERAKRLSWSGPPPASPEVVAGFMKQLNEVVSKIAESKSVDRPRHKGPVLDETYDWESTFRFLDEIKKLPMTDYAVPTVPKKERVA